MEKVPLLRSGEVKHGAPQYIIQHGKDLTSISLCSWTPSHSQQIGQHAVIFRSKDPKTIASYDGASGTMGTVYMQDAFDRHGVLRRGTSDPNFRWKTKGWPIHEENGMIYGFCKDGNFANAEEVESGLKFPAILTHPSLSLRLDVALSEQLAKKAAQDSGMLNNNPEFQRKVTLVDAAYTANTPCPSERASWGSARTFVSLEANPDLSVVSNAHKDPKKDKRKQHQSKIKHVKSIDTNSLVPSKAKEPKKADPILQKRRNMERMEAELLYFQQEESKMAERLEEFCKLTQPMKEALQEINDRISIQKVLMNKYKEENGTGVMLASLGRELREEQSKAQVAEAKLQAFLPKEISRSRQLEAKKTQIAKHIDKIQAARSSLDDLITSAHAQIRIDKAGKILDESMIFQNEQVLMEDTKDAVIDKVAHFNGVPNSSGEFYVLQSKQTNRKDSEEVRPSKEANTTNRHGKENALDQADYSYFRSPESWLRRNHLAARANSPRWKERLLGELASWKSNFLLPVRAKTMEQTQMVVQRAPTHFEAKIRMPSKLSEIWESFCRKPHLQQYEPCITCDMLVSSRNHDLIQVTFASEPKGHFKSFFESFRSMCSDKGIADLSMEVVSFHTKEDIFYTSLQERWASEGLCHDVDADKAVLTASVPRPEEKKIYRDRIKSWTEPLVGAEASEGILRMCPWFKTSTIKFLTAVKEIVSVLQVPAGQRIVEQAANSDCMYIVASGNVLQLQEAIGDRRRLPIATLTCGASIGEICLLEPSYMHTSTYDCADSGAALLYRITTKSYHALLAQYPSAYQDLKELSIRRFTEWKANYSSAREDQDGVRPPRWRQVSGRVHFAPAGLVTTSETIQKTKLELPGIFAAASRGSERAKLIRQEVSEWREGGLQLATEVSTGFATTQVKVEGWWEDHGKRGDAYRAMERAETHAERFAANERRASSLVWRTQSLRRQGLAVVASIQ